MSGAGTRLGVDLGTTWTAAALRRGGHVTALDLGTGAPAMPSVVALDGEAVVVGERAERQLLSDPTTGLRECKRRLGDTTPMVMGGRPYGAEALMGHMLRHVVEVATAAAGGPPDEVVLTHPANWGEYKLDLLREVGRQAGVGEVTLVPEPVAAALHYASLGRLSTGDVVAVYDFGGGTFDATVVRCGESGAEVLGRPEGLERLGGVDLDQIVVLHVDEALDGRLRELDTTDPEGRRALARLRAECTSAKEALSDDTEVAIPVALPGLTTEVRLTRDELESAARARIADTLGALDRTIADAGVDPSTLTGVLLVGGSSR
ncbi:MAG TPA: Hsp70 family protein, partial [Acidimicrobiales bacterium]